MENRKFKRVLVANRGEIAIRIFILKKIKIRFSGQKQMNPIE